MLSHVRVSPVRSSLPRRRAATNGILPRSSSVAECVKHAIVRLIDRVPAVSDPESIDFQQVLATLHAWIGKHVFVTVGAAGRRPYAACWTQGTLRRTTETTVHTDVGSDREAIDFNLGVPGLTSDDDTDHREWTPAGFRLTPGDFTGGKWDGKLLEITVGGCSLLMRCPDADI